MATFPSFYNPSRIGTLFTPDMAAIAASTSAEILSPAANDSQQVHLVLIDMQVDFCHPHGALYVPGAEQDIQRVIEYIYTYGDRISQITCSLDTHLPSQIFHPEWWLDAEDNHPDPFTLISYADVEAGKWRPAHQAAWSAEYVRLLEQEAKKVLTIWPYHVLLGSIGHALDPELFSAVMWHSLARQTQPNWLTKGMIPQTEHYSIIQPEVAIAGDPRSEPNQAFLDQLASADKVLIAGEASSHCVLESVEDMVEVFGPRGTLSNFHLMTDCTSAVVHPDIDFDAIAQEAFGRFAEQGLHLIESSDPPPF